MFCRYCGASNNNIEQNCVKCGKPLLPVVQKQNEPQQKISSNLGLSIVSFFFVWPLAIVALVYATKVNTLLASGNYEEATKASRLSKKWALWSIILGIIVLVVNILVQLSIKP